jgi:hypothetical protein
MPRLKDKSISLVGFASAVALSGTSTIFSGETGKSTVVTDVWISSPTSSCAAATAINFGAYYNNSANFTLAAATATTNVLNLRPAATQTAWTVLPQGASFVYTVVSGCAASANIHVFGFTY